MRHCRCLLLAFPARILSSDFRGETTPSSPIDGVDCAPIEAHPIPACVSMLYLYKKILIAPIQVIQLDYLDRIHFPHHSVMMTDQDAMQADPQGIKIAV